MSSLQNDIKIKYQNIDNVCDSVCVDHVFKASFDDLFFRNDSITVEEIGDIVKKNVWSRNETFYFVDFPSDSNSGYPCMTSRDSYDPNKPCMFPFYWGDHFLDNCTDLDNGGEFWCYTKLGQDLRVELGQSSEVWGLCGPRCQGQENFIKRKLLLDKS